MNHEILAHYYTDNQMAVIMGITLGGLRNKIYREKTEDLPEYISVGSRTRIWSKLSVKEYLLKQYHGNAQMAEILMKKGEKASPGATFEKTKK